jgi:predicted glycoside hydrolase/deacetylase ChbG (UPF0249 family)
MSGPRGLVLCADDYGLSDAVSDGILDLARLGRISATSVMTTMPALEGRADALAAERIAVGLHVTLTEGRPLGPMPGFAPAGHLPALKRVLRLSLMGRLPLDEISAEIGRQFDRFGALFGRAPDFVDGHQHVHVLPGIEQALLAALARVDFDAPPWLRDPSDRMFAILRRPQPAKAMLVHALAAGFRRRAIGAGWETNDGFSGFSAFAGESDSARDMEGFLSRLGPAPVVMCHPGRPDGQDPIGPARARERDYLASATFGAQLERHRIELVTRPG